LLRKKVLNVHLLVVKVGSFMKQLGLVQRRSLQTFRGAWQLVLIVDDNR